MDIWGQFFNITDNTIKNCSRYGINLDNRDHLYYFRKNIINNNNLENNYVGINLKTTHNDKVRNNTNKNSTYGIYSDNAIILEARNNTIQGTNNSVRLLNGESVTLTENHLEGTDRGVWMSSCAGTNISSNRVLDHRTGITLDESNKITLSLNKISGHDVGISTDSGSRNLYISRNSLVDNDVHVIDDGEHVWDLNGYGNYWTGLEDYHDWDGDGIVDRPVEIDDDSVDNYPLIVPWGQPWNRKIELGPMQSER